ncbi:hypothetical protein PFISCL1PPCAC_6569, partial [Pristionchus fissidentatus]
HYYESKSLREILSAEAFYRIEIIPEIRNIYEKSGRVYERDPNHFYLNILAQEIQARRQHYYQKLEERNVTPIPLEGPESHVWLRSNNRGPFLYDAEYTLYVRDTEHIIECRERCHREGLGYNDWNLG